MSHQMWNLHNYNKPPRAQPPVYQQGPNGQQWMVTDPVAEAMASYNQNIPAHSYIQQTAEIQNRHMTPFLYNVEASSSSSQGLRRYAPDQNPVNFMYQQPAHGVYKPDLSEQVIARAMNNGRVLTRRTQVNARPQVVYQNRMDQRRVRGKTQYYNFSPELIRYIDPATLERRHHLSELDYVELLLCNPNRAGYITLDNKAMSILVNAIDEALPKNLNLKLLAESTFYVPY